MNMGDRSVQIEAEELAEALLGVPYFRPAAESFCPECVQESITYLTRRLRSGNPDALHMMKIYEST
jgi:hypothetical protein